MADDHMRALLRDRLEDTLKGKLKALKVDLTELAKVELREALEDLANLTLYQFRLNDEAEKLVVDMEIKHARARIANWTFVGADMVREALKQTLHEVAEVVGSLLKGFIK
jgi:hypothetical protein